MGYKGYGIAQKRNEPVFMGIGWTETLIEKYGARLDSRNGMKSLSNKTAFLVWFRAAVNPTNQIYFVNLHKKEKTKFIVRHG